MFSQYALRAEPDAADFLCGVVAGFERVISLPLVLVADKASDLLSAAQDIVARVSSSSRESRWEVVCMSILFAAPVVRLAVKISERTAALLSVGRLQVWRVRGV